MARKRKGYRRGTGLADQTASSALSWFNSANNNFRRLQNRRGSGSDCTTIEHYTDVIAEATAAEALAPRGSAIATRADNLRRQATHAQRAAVQVCRRESVTKSRK